MFKLKYIVAIFMLSAAMVGAIVSCSKVVHGYLSDRVFYQVNPFSVQQGVTAVSSSLVADGSTAPLHVKVLALRDSLGHNADSILTTPRTIVTYTGTVTYLDTTLDQLKAKLKDSLVSPFNIAEIGGRLQFTAATKYVPAGSYNMDISVTNVRDTKVIENACQINITGLGNTTNLLFKRLRYWDNGTGDGGYNREDQGGITVDINYQPGTPQTKVTYKFVDKNYQPFNPAAGDVTRFRVDWPVFENWCPYYKPVYTDSTIEYRVPDIGLSFPYYPSTVINGTSWNDNYTALCYYKIVAAANKKHQLIQALTSIQYLAAGTYVVTIRVPDAERIVH